MRDSTHLSERAAHQAVDWAAAEDWNPGLDDVHGFRAADADAFMAADEDGELVGTVSCRLHGPDYAFIGFYIVRSDRRGRGIATELFDRALAHAGERVIGLDGVLEQQPVHASLGFLDVPHANPAAVEIAAARLDAPVFETARMYRNGRPPEDVARVFGVTTLELG